MFSNKVLIHNFFALMNFKMYKLINHYFSFTGACSWVHILAASCVLGFVRPTGVNNFFFN